MLFISGLNLDSAFNLACEEYLLHEFEEEIFILWQNEKSIVIGKHQNALAEINIPYTLKNKIPVVRRLSGGGTVFHDMGNINFTFIRNAAQRDKMIDFKKYAQPILNAIKSLGIHAYFSERNDIFIDGLKVSGNAEHLYQKKKRVLHHGTLLFNSHLDELNEAIRTDPERYIDKAVNSVRSKVANISDYLLSDISIMEFKQHVYNAVWLSDENPQSYALSEVDRIQIEQLAETKYRRWEWNYGYSPGYQVERTLSIENSLIPIILTVEKGKIIEVNCQDSRFHGLKEIMHQPEAIHIKLSEVFAAIDLDDLILQLF